MHRKLVCCIISYDIHLHVPLWISYDMINSATTTMTSGIKAQNEGKALVEDTDRHIKRHTGTASNVDSGSIRVHTYEET